MLLLLLLLLLSLLLLLPRLPQRPLIPPVARPPLPLSPHPQYINFALTAAWIHVPVIHSGLLSLPSRAFSANTRAPSPAHGLLPPTPWLLRQHTGFATHGLGGRHTGSLANTRARWPTHGLPRQHTGSAATTPRWPTYGLGGQHTGSAATTRARWPTYGLGGQHTGSVATIRARWPTYRPGGQQTGSVAIDGHAQPLDYTNLRLEASAVAVVVVVHVVREKEKRLLPVTFVRVELRTAWQQALLRTYLRLHKATPALRGNARQG